jgi:hypothetical protein
MSQSYTNEPAQEPLLKFPVLDYSFHRPAMKAPMLDSSVPCVVQVKYPALKQAKSSSPTITSKSLSNYMASFPATSTNTDGAVVGKPLAKDHVWGRETCAANGCKTCCECGYYQGQCDNCADDNIFAWGRQIHEASLHEW